MKFLPRSMNMLAKSAISIALFAFGIMAPADAIAFDELSIDTEGWHGDFITNGWQISASDKTADGHLWFNAGGNFLLSPKFNGNIIWIEIQARCSNDTPLRLLGLTVCHDSEILISTNVTPTTTKGDYERFDIMRTLQADNFRLDVEKGKNGAWTIYSIRVGIEKCRVIEASVRRVSSSTFTLSWSNGADVLSNELYVANTVRVPQKTDYKAFYDFSFLTNETGNTKSVLAEITKRWSGFDGTNVNLPGNAGGYAMLGNSTRSGYLTYESLGDCNGQYLIINAQKYPYDGEGSVMPIFAIANGTTNNLATLTLSTEPTTFTIPLSGLQIDTSFVFHSVTNRSTASRANARTILKSFGIADGYQEEKTVTNILRHIYVKGTETLQITGLSADSEYLWSIRGIGNDNLTEAWPPWNEVRTMPASGNALYVR